MTELPPERADPVAASTAGPYKLRAAALARTARQPRGTDPYAWIQQATREHRVEHGCRAFTFADGRQIQALATAARPTRVLELGTAVGYTAASWAIAAATVDTIERDPTHVALARANIAQAGLADRVRVHEGDFQALLGQLRGPYDVAFFDGHVPDSHVLSLLAQRLARPGLLVVTNLQWADPEFSRSLGSLVGHPEAETQPVDEDLALSVIA